MFEVDPEIQLACASIAQVSRNLSLEAEGLHKVPPVTITDYCSLLAALAYVETQSNWSKVLRLDVATRVFLSIIIVLMVIVIVLCCLNAARRLTKLRTARFGRYEQEISINELGGPRNTANADFYHHHDYEDPTRLFYRCQSCRRAQEVVHLAEGVYDEPYVGNSETTDAPNKVEGEAPMFEGKEYFPS